MPITPDRERLIQQVISEDPLARLLWRTYAQKIIAAGHDPNQPPAGILPFNSFVLQGIHRESGAEWLRRNTDLDQEAQVQRAERRAGVVADVEAIWGTALALLERVIILSERFVGDWVPRLGEYVEGRLVTEHTLLWLLSRSIQVAEETLILLRAGMAAGAEARWRTLHELAVIGAFIALDEGDNTATRYLAHDKVKWYQRMQAEQEHHERLGFPPYTAEEMRAAKAEHDRVIHQFRPYFNTDYGWAFAAIQAAEANGGGKSRPGQAKGRKRGNSPTAPRLRDLEALVDLGHFKAAHASASAQIHGGAAGLFDHPARDTLRVPAFLARAIPVGLREPAVRAVAALHILSRCLVLRVGAPEELLTLMALDQLASDCVHAFVAAEEQSDRVAEA